MQASPTLARGSFSAMGGMTSRGAGAGSEHTGEADVNMEDQVEAPASPTSSTSGRGDGESPVEELKETDSSKMSGDGDGDSPVVELKETSAMPSSVHVDGENSVVLMEKTTAPAMLIDGDGVGPSPAVDLKEAAASTMLVDVDGDSPPVEPKATKAPELPDRCLQKIFSFGIKHYWCAEEEGNAGVAEDGIEDVDVPDLPEASAPLQAYSEVLQLMDCARVCKSWFKAATSPCLWEELKEYPHFGSLADELDPLLLGSKWNAHFKQVAVTVPVCETHMEENVQRIEVAAAQNRASFTLCTSPSDLTDNSVHVGWQKIRPHLHEHAASIKIDGFPLGRGISLYHFLGKPWRNLKNLEIDQSAWTIFPEHVFEDCQQWWRDVKQGTPTPPLPALKNLTLTGHSHSYIGSDVAKMVPNLDRFILHVERFRKCRMTSGRGTDKIGIILTAFLSTRNFRLYTMTAMVVAVRMPVPPGFNRDECWVGHEDGVPEYEDETNRFVALSEVSQQGRLCLANVPMDEFFGLEDANDVVMLATLEHVTLPEDDCDGYLSQRFTTTQYYVRQLIANETLEVPEQTGEVTQE